MLKRYKSNVFLEEKVSCEIRELPSMMWKRSIVQAEVRFARAYAHLVLVFTIFAVSCSVGNCADLVIEIPGWGSEGAEGAERAHYRLDYTPPQGTPPPNFIVPAKASTINFQGLPGTKYHFMLYYSNATFADLLTWNQTIITAPEPPTNLTVALGRNKQATISWAPPAHGDYTGFRFKVVPLTERGAGGARNVTVEGAGNWTYLLRDLSPGATYQLHAFTLLHDKESAAYASYNFTTKPNTPGKFIVWFRNETTLLVLWQPPYPPGAYTHYKVSIEPRDARESELYVEKEGEPPGPAQAAFKGLVPGRAYNISVQTVSDAQLSAPTTAQYRTVPLRPAGVSVPALAETAFTVAWLPPAEPSEFEKYQVSVAAAGAGARRLPAQVRSRDDPPACTFDGLEPGAHYAVSVKTMSGKVTSWPAAADVTLRPLPVRELRAVAAEPPRRALQLRWAPAEGSTQDEYRVSYHEADGARDDSSSLIVAAPDVTLDALLPGRNYTITVSAVSRGVASNASATWAATRPLAPVLRAAAGGERSLRLAWSADVESRQDGYELTYRRRAPAAPAAELRTAAAEATLADLWPGAVYELRLLAVSHGLRSEPLVVLKPVRPLPPEWLGVERATSNSVVVRWRGPPAGSVGRYLLRYRTAAGPDLALDPLPPNATSAEITDMTHGERYTITLDAGSEDAGGEVAESGSPQAATHTVRPNPVSNVAQMVDPRNITLDWPRPAGRVDLYRVRWWPEPEPGDAPTAAAPPAERNVSAAVGRVTLDGLRPGRAYGVSISAHSYDLVSDVFTMHTRTRPLILSEMKIVNDSDRGEGGDGAESEGEAAAPSVQVLYTRTPDEDTLFDAYRLRLDSAGDAPRTVERPAAAAPQRVTFDRLVPGRLYNLTMWTVARNVTSHPVQQQTRLFPRPVRALNATVVGAREVTLRWERPLGDYTDFELQYLHSPDRLATLATTEPELTVRDLRPYTAYTFSLEVRSGTPATILTRSPARSLNVTTREAPPAAPSDFRPSDAAPTELTFTWSLPPEDAHGVLRRFVLEYAPADGSEQSASMELPPDARTGRVTGLRAGAAYEFRLRAESGAGPGAAARYAQVMAIGAPPRPRAHALPAEVRRGATSVAVRFRSDYFSAANGNVTAYTLVVAEEPRESPEPLPGWADVHRLPVWPPYQVTEPYYPFASAAVEEFTLGAERCDPPHRPYCNGPLKPGTRYYVKLRAYTAPDKFTDTAYAPVYTEADHTGWIAGGCVAAALLAAGAGALLLRRRRSRPPPAPRAAPASRPVRVADFLDHYRLMSADSDFRFSEEFEELKHVGREQPCTAADLPVNRPKNRFTNILPYDHSRYKLQPVDDEEGSDYINANYVPGHNSPREFIVTQGPLHCTRDDFWRMCWESGSRAIVMLTRCVEKGREKCDRYWPYDTRPVYYGDIAVTALNESRYPDWTVTELGVCRGAEQRVVRHFHFTTWPDFGVPSPPAALARFVRAFRERVGPDTRPVVVHCSAGVGRSGTFIALDRALQQLAAGADTLDIFGMVHALRRERVWMVQTEQQYICIHQCVAAALDGQDLAPPPPNNHHHNPAFEDPA
ncbi:tyrosine-protein phosphatase 10D isoform X2 [Aricia agestis]|uniref:tyrosine-protein phosphatase 10D isoform X2 n=1 Tax=Aricia agestis TaxID=91739 RepID=UPI001C2057A6|nr:tyrosine-protein phosphatase 10D isoform X2 [Aricia agestis]